VQHALIDELTRTAIEAAEIGAQVHRAGWASGFAVRAKGDHGDSVTEIDLDAERAIRTFLSSARPDDSVIGEESEIPTRLAPICWIVDPIDGTANYLRRSADFAVSIGVTIDGEHAIGVVQQTAADRQWVAARQGVDATASRPPWRSDRTLPTPSGRPDSPPNPWPADGS
jgi:myo-inositol-1(or 4)-monophosphatase